MSNSLNLVEFIGVAIIL